MSDAVRCPDCGHDNSPSEDFCSCCSRDLASVPGGGPAPAGAAAERRPAEASPDAELRAGSGERFRLFPGCTVGRGADVDLSTVAESEYISRLQARFAFDGTRWWLEAVSTGNETRLNGVRVEAKARIALGAGDALSFGGVLFSFRPRF